MATRKTDPEPFPVRGTPSAYRDRWESDERALIEDLIAERERQLVAVRENAGPHPGGRSRGASAPAQPAAPADRIAPDP